MVKAFKSFQTDAGKVYLAADAVESLREGGFSSEYYTEIRMVSGATYRVQALLPRVFERLYGKLRGRDERGVP